MKLSRQKFWILLQVFVILIISFYGLLWFTAVKTDGYVLGFSEGTKDFPVTIMHVEYYAKEIRHVATFLYDKDFYAYRTGQTIELSYLPFARGSARLPNFNAGDMLFILIYIIWLFISSLIFLMPNYFIGKKSTFQISWKFPFVKYYSGKATTYSETVKLIVNANFVAGLIEKFMFPFVGSGVIALILYVSTWNSILVVLSLSIGSILGILRALKWKKSLRPGDDELEVIDQLPTFKD